MEYVGEHLLPGQIGRFAIVLGFVASLLAAISYYYATQRREKKEAGTWLKMGRYAFVLHGLSFFTVIGILFYIMINHYYEYQYVQSHVSDELPFRYVFSAFWQPQEGSFLLWIFWHIVLGFILIKKAKNWKVSKFFETNLCNFIKECKCLLLGPLGSLEKTFPFLDFFRLWNTKIDSRFRNDKIYVISLERNPGE